jgi:hypothetical protein
MMREATRESKHGFALGGFADGGGQFVGFDILEQVRNRPGAHCREDVLVLVVRGDDDHLVSGRSLRIWRVAAMPSNSPGISRSISTTSGWCCLHRRPQRPQAVFASLTTCYID